MIRPIYPSMFGSGIFIDSFSPKTEKESASLIKALKAFAVDLVIVLDNNHLKFKIDQQIKEINETLGRETVVYFMQKPQGVTANSTDEYSLVQEYFKGRNHRLMQNQELIKKKIQMIAEDVDVQAREARETSVGGVCTVPRVDEEGFMLDLTRQLNVFHPQDLRLLLDDYKVFEIKCNEIPITALPAGAKAPRFDTEFEKINPAMPTIASKMASYKRHIAGVMVPADADEFANIEAQMTLDRSNIKLKQDFEDCLKRCICIELIQIKDFYENAAEGAAAQGSSQMLRHLEVRTTRGTAAAALGSNIIFIGRM